MLNNFFRLTFCCQHSMKNVSQRNKNVEQKIVGYFLFLFILSGYNSFKHLQHNRKKCRREIKCGLYKNNLLGILFVLSKY